MSLLIALLFGRVGVAAAAPALERVDLDTPDGRRTAYVQSSAQGIPTGLVVLLRDSGSGVEAMRSQVGTAFEDVAPEGGWILVYAEALDGLWNDCRRTPYIDTKTTKIDDVGCLARLTHTIRSTCGVPAGRTLVAGFAGGGQMAIRLAMERSDLVDGLFAMSAPLPTGSESTCVPSHRPVQALFVDASSKPDADLGRMALQFMQSWPSRIIMPWQQATAEQRERLELCVAKQRWRRPAGCLRPLLSPTDAAELITSF